MTPPLTVRLSCTIVHPRFSKGLVREGDQKGAGARGPTRSVHKSTSWTRQTKSKEAGAGGQEKEQAGSRPAQRKTPATSSGTLRPRTGEVLQLFGNPVKSAFGFPLFYYRAPPDELPYELVQILAGKAEEPAYLPAGSYLSFLEIFQDVVFRPHNFIMVHPDELSTAEDGKIRNILKKRWHDCGKSRSLPAISIYRHNCKLIRASHGGAGTEVIEKSRPLPVLKRHIDVNKSCPDKVGVDKGFVLQIKVTETGGRVTIDGIEFEKNPLIFGQSLQKRHCLPVRQAVSAGRPGA